MLCRIDVYTTTHHGIFATLFGHDRIHMDLDFSFHYCVLQEQANEVLDAMFEKKVCVCILAK